MFVAGRSGCLPADLCLTDLQFSTDQCTTRKQLWGFIHSRAFRETKYTWRLNDVVFIVFSSTFISFRLLSILRYSIGYIKLNVQASVQTTCELNENKPTPFFPRLFFTKGTGASSLQFLTQHAP